MRIPVRSRLQDRRDDPSDTLKAPPFQGQTAPLFPPGLDQVEPAGICRHQQQLHLRPGQQGGLRRPRDMCTQISRDQPPFLRGIRLQDQFQARHQAGAVPSGAAQGCGQAGSRLDGAQAPHAAAPAIIRGQRRPARSTPPPLPRIRLGTDGAEFVKAEDPPRRDRLRVGLDDGPLFW